MSNTFCALPFQHLCVGPESTARICCVTTEMVTEYGAPMSLNVHTLDEIWNSAYMRNVRRAMLKGERISTCETCYQSEKVTGVSYRTTVGAEPLGNGLVRPEDMKRFAASGFRVESRPAFLKL